jgi:probable HAF family extracellular repeat protein
MKITLGFKLRGFILAAAFSAGLGFGTSASAQVRHSFLVDLNSKTVTDIGTLGGDESRAYGINDAGQVVGWSTTAGGAQHAFITGPNGMGMRDLGTLGGLQDFSFASGISDAGQVVGWSQTAGGASHAFITGPGGMGMRDLGTLGGDYSRASGINDAGQAVGDSSTAGGADHAFITGPHGMGMRDLGTLSGATDSTASGINDAGQVVGRAHTARGAQHAFITGPNGMGMRDLGTLGGGYSYANGINDTGWAVGGAEAHIEFPTPDRQPVVHAFVFDPNGMGMRDLGTLSGAYSSAYGINDTGQVVGASGYSSDPLWADTYSAFITGPNGAGMMNLNSLVDLPRTVFLTSATGINNAGQVIAHAVIIPEPEIYALFLAGLGLIGFIGRQKKMSGKIFSLGQAGS